MITLFNRKPNTSELKRLSEIHQVAKPKVGIQDFSYTVADFTPDIIARSTNDNISPINVKSQTHLNHITNNNFPGGQILKFANTTALVDTGNLFEDVITEDLCKQLCIPYEHNSSPSLHSANGQPINIIGRTKNDLTFKFNNLNKFFRTKPFVVKELFCGIMLSVFFTKKYKACLDSIDDTIRLHTKLGSPRTHVKLHLNTIGTAIRMLDVKDRNRLLEQKKQDTEDIKGTNRKKINMEVTQEDLDKIGLKPPALHAALKASHIEKHLAFAKNTTPLSIVKINTKNAPSSFRCEICKDIMSNASKMSCCMNSVCNNCGINSLIDSGMCYNIKCRDMESQIFDDKSMRKKIDMYKEKKEMKQGAIRQGATVKVLAGIQSLDDSIREVLVENLEQLNGIDVKEGVYRRRLDGSVDLWIAATDPDDITSVNANQPVALITPIVPRHQITEEFGSNIVESMSDVIGTMAEVTDDFTMANTKINKLRDEIDDMTERLKVSSIAPQQTVFELKKLTKELKDVLDKKTKLEIDRIRKEIPKTTCNCHDGHITTRRDIPHDEKQNPNGFTTNTAVSTNICTLDWTVEEKKKWLENQFKLNDNALLQEDENFKERVTNMLLENWSAFSITAVDYGHTDVTQFKIRIKAGIQPYRGKVRPMNPADEEALEEQLTKWLNHGIIEKCHSEFASPLFCVRKGDKRRFVIDYRMINRFIERDAFPLPNIEENLQKLAGSSVYSTLDATAAFHSVEIAPDSREYTGFICSKGHYQYIRLPFGFSNGPAMYSRIIQKLLIHIGSENLMGYLDDLIIHAKDNETMLQALNLTLTAHREFGLKINPAKSELFQKKVIYLGHLCSKEGIDMVPRYRKILEEWEVPKSQGELKTYLGKITYYKRFFTMDFSRLKAPLDSLRAKEKDFEMGDKELRAFYALRKLITESGDKGPLAFPDFSDNAGPFKTDSDFSIDGLGWALSQEQGKQERLIGCGGRKTSKSENNYPSSKGEILALVSCFQDFERILTFKHFFARVDAQALLTLKSTYNIRSHLVSRWAEYIASFDFTPVHRPGVLHGNVDHISRYSGLREPTTSEIEASEKAEILDIKSDLIGEQNNKRIMAINESESTIAKRVKGSRERKKVIKFDNSETRTKKKGKEKETKLVEKDKDPFIKDTDETFSDIVTGEDVQFEDNDIKFSDKIILGEDGDRIAHTELGPANPPGCEWTAARLEKEFPIELDKIIVPGELLEAQKRDKILSEVYQWVKSGNKPEKKIVKHRLKEVLWYLALYNYLHIDDRGILLYKDNYQNKDLICLPDSLMDKVFHLCHIHPLSAHFALASTLKRVRFRFMFPHMTAIVATKLMGCQGCVQKIAKDPYKHSVFCSREVPGINEKINWDIVGPLPLSENNNMYILSIVDYFSRWLEMIPIPDKSATTIARAIYSNWICRYGTFAQLHADNSKEFHSNLVEEVAKSLEIYQTFIPKYRPGGARVERTHNTVFQAIRALRQSEGKEQDAWEELLDPVLFAYRSSVCRATGFTPAFLWLGRELRAPIDIVFPFREEKYNSASEFAQKICREAKKAFLEVNARFESTALIQDAIYSSRPQQKTFNPGDIVLYFSPYRRLGEFRKLHLHWTGPFRIVSKISDILYEIASISDRKGQTPLLATNDRLKKYREEHNDEDRGTQEIQATFPYFVSEENIENGNIDAELSRQVSVVEFTGAPHNDGNESTRHNSESRSTDTPSPADQSEAHSDCQSTEDTVTDNITQMEERIDSDTGLLENDQNMDMEIEQQQPDAKRKREEETPTKNQPEKVSRLDTNREGGQRRLFAESDLAREVAKFEDLS